MAAGLWRRAIQALVFGASVFSAPAPAGPKSWDKVPILGGKPDPAGARVQARLSVMLFSLNRLAEAEEAARRALALNPGLAPAHYWIGRILAAEQRRPYEALEHLQKALPSIAEAHLVMAQILAQAGIAEDAARQVEHYLRIVPKIAASPAHARLVAACLQARDGNLAALRDSLREYLDAGR
ncbi:MAG: hypothetical protein HYR60_31615 [Acidobacteria bacterium]|nr:hypothetical protein [Acidobacteriota bacterium]